MNMKLVLYRAGLGRKRCPRGKIRRKGYTTKRGVRVPSTCIPDRGRPGKGPKTLPTPVEGSLRGWKKDMSPSKRRAILKKIVRGRTRCATVLRRLVLLRNISSDPGTDRAAKADQTWLRAQPFCKLKTKEHAR